MLTRFFSAVDLCRVAVTLVFSAALALAAIPPERDPALDPGYGWDWCHVPFYHRYNIPSPWEPTQRIGVDLSLEICTAKQQHDAGWELYHRRIDLKDELLFNQVNPLEPPQLAPDVFFTLYNRHTGLLRSFAWIGPSDVDFGDFFSIGLHVSDGDEQVFLGHGHFAYAGGGHAFSLADRYAGNTGNMMYFTKRHKREVWVVVETELSYDPYSHLTASGEEPPLLFFYQLLTHNEADIRLVGSMSLTLNQEVENSGGTLGAVMNSLWKNRDTVSDGAAP